MCKNEFTASKKTYDDPGQKRPVFTPIALFNGAIITTNGLYRLSDISLKDACELIRQNGFISAIGHVATAEILSELFNIPVQMNRIDFEQQVGQKAIVFKLNQRTPEGSILNKAEIEKIGYSLKLMERLD